MPINDKIKTLREKLAAAGVVAAFSSDVQGAGAVNTYILNLSDDAILSKNQFATMPVLIDQHDKWVEAFRDSKSYVAAKAAAVASIPIQELASEIMTMGKLRFPILQTIGNYELQVALWPQFQNLQVDKASNAATYLWWTVGEARTFGFTNDQIGYDGLTNDEPPVKIPYDDDMTLLWIDIRNGFYGGSILYYDSSLAEPVPTGDYAVIQTSVENALANYPQIPEASALVQALADGWMFPTDGWFIASIDKFKASYEPVPGPQGLQGVQGERGIDGSPGSAGVPGAPGAPGAPGVCDCPDIGGPTDGTIDPPPDPGAQPPPDYPPDPTVPLDGGFVDLVCADNLVKNWFGTNHVGNLLDYGTSLIIGIGVLLPVNDLLLAGEDIRPEIETAIANSGTLPGGAVVTQVRLGYTYYCTGIFNLNASFADWEGGPRWDFVNGRSVLPYIILNDDAASKLVLPATQNVPQADYNISFGAGVVGSFRWNQFFAIGEVNLSGYDLTSTVKVSTKLLPHLPVIPFSDLTSPGLEFCLEGYTYKLPGAVEVLIRASMACDLYEHSGSYSNDWTNMTGGDQIYDGTTGVKSEIVAVCFAYHLGYGAGAKIGFGQQSWRDANPGLDSGEYFGISGTDGGTAEQFFWAHPAYNTGNSFVLTFSSILAIRVTIAAFKTSAGLTYVRSNGPVCAGWGTPAIPAACPF